MRDEDLDNHGPIVGPDGGEEDASVREWCAGLPLVAQRTLTDAEKRLLRREVWIHRGYSALVYLSFPVGLFTLLCLLVMVPEAVSGPKADPSVWLLLLILVPFAILVARSEDILKRRRGLSKDLKKGYVKRYAGPLESLPLHDETFQQFQVRRLLPETIGQEWEFEVLPVSRKVWTVGGVPLSNSFEATWTDVAETPSFAGLAAQWLEPVAKSETETLYANQRELSTEEVEELRRYANRLWWKPFPYALGLTLWWGIPVGFILTGASKPSQSTHDRFFYGFLTLLVLRFDFRLVKAVLLSRKLHKDARTGRVVILKVRRDRKSEDEGADNGELPEESETFEQLPFSRAVWTVAGKPTAWRVSKL